MISSSPPTSRPFDWRVAVVLLLMAIAVVLERTRTYSEPLENDIAGYAVIGHELLAGRKLYTDLWDRKPPLMVDTFVAAERLVGYGPAEVFTLNVAAALATLVGCYFAGRVSGGATAGLVAAGLWVLLGGDPYTQANQPNAEVFVNAALTAAVALLARRSMSWRSALAVGGLFTLGTMYEQHVIVTCAALAAGYLIAGGRLRHMAIAAAVGAVAWAGLVAYLAFDGRLSAAVNVLYFEPLHGVSMARNIADALALKNLFPPHMTWVGGPLALILIGAIAGPARMHESERAHARTAGAPDVHPGLLRQTTTRTSPLPGRQQWSIWAGWIVGTWVVVALPGRFFPHYYQCWIPPMCVAGGWSAARLLNPNRWRRPVGALAVAAVFVALGVRQLPPYRWSPEEWSNRKYAGENFVEQAYLARRLMTILRPDERYWIIGQDCTVYFMTKQSPASGLLYLEPVIDGANPTYWSRMIADLNRADPQLLLVHFPWDHALPADSPLMPWVNANYVPAGTNLTCTTYDFYLRRGNEDLLRRLQNPPPSPPYHRAEWASERAAPEHAPSR